MKRLSHVLPVVLVLSWSVRKVEGSWPVYAFYLCLAPVALVFLAMLAMLAAARNGYTPVAGRSALFAARTRSGECWNWEGMANQGAFRGLGARLNEEDWREITPNKQMGDHLSVFEIFSIFATGANVRR